MGHKTTTVLVFLVFYTFCNFCTIYFVGVNFLSAPERPETETETRRALNYNVYKKTFTVAMKLSVKDLVTIYYKSTNLTVVIMTGQTCKCSQQQTE